MGPRAVERNEEPPASSLVLLESSAGYCQYFMDLSLWQPHIEAVFSQRGISCRSVHPGLAGSFPTFIVNERWVIKFFGVLFGGATCWQVEKEAAGLLARERDIPAPGLVASGNLEPYPDWHYLIFDFIPGTSIGENSSRVSHSDRSVLAHGLGQMLRRMHRMEISPDSLLPRLTKVKMLG